MLRDTHIACPVNAMAGGAYNYHHTFEVKKSLRFN
jgi:hypothetical protein